MDGEKRFRRLADSESSTVSPDSAARISSVSHHLGVLFLSGDKSDEFGRDVAAAFEQAGCTVYELLVDEPWPDQLQDLVIYGPFGSLAPLIKRLETKQGHPRIVIWYTEGLPNPTYPGWFIKFLGGCLWCIDDVSDRFRFGQRLSLPRLRVPRTAGGRIRYFGQIRKLQAEGRLGLLAVISRSRFQFFERAGFTTVYVPIGYSPMFGRPLDLERDIDVTFLGTTRDPRRKRIIQEIQRQLSSREIRFVIKDGTPENGYVWREDRTQLINRSKIMLNVMRESWDCPMVRILFSAPNGAMVISEPVGDTEPFVPGKHFVAVALDQMVETIQFYLHHEDRRAQIARAAFDFVMKELTMSTMAGRILEELQARP